MDRICKVCSKIKKTPYRDICRGCYQKQWEENIEEKICNVCKLSFKSAGKTCFSCQDKKRREDSRKIPCKGCLRIGLQILNKTRCLCTKCDRNEKENKEPDRKEIRRRQTRESNRRSKGKDVNAPVRRSTGAWKTKSGYILIYKPEHPNSNVNGCIFQHCYVMSQHIGRSLNKGESVHHINGVRDDNRIENLEIWHRSHPPGQRLGEKIEWAKKFLEEYGFDVKLKI